MHKPTPFFSIDAMQYIKDIGVKHLLVDTPSVDRLYDEGILSAHNISDTKDKNYNPNTKHKTITMTVDNSIDDGNYLLTLQIPAFVSDATIENYFKINEL